MGIVRVVFRGFTVFRDFFIIGDWFGDRFVDWVELFKFLYLGIWSFVRERGVEVAGY